MTQRTRYRGLGGNGGRGQYHQCIVWREVHNQSMRLPWLYSQYWHAGEWRGTYMPITVESIYGGHTQWIADQVTGKAVGRTR